MLFGRSVCAGLMLAALAAPAMAKEPRQCKAIASAMHNAVGTNAEFLKAATDFFNKVAAETPEFQNNKDWQSIFDQMDKATKNFDGDTITAGTKAVKELCPDTFK